MYSFSPDYKNTAFSESSSTQFFFHYECLVVLLAQAVVQVVFFVAEQELAGCMLDELYDCLGESVCYKI